MPDPSDNRRKRHFTRTREPATSRPVKRLQRTARTPAKTRAKRRSAAGSRQGKSLAAIVNAAAGIAGASEAKLSPGFFEPQLARLFPAPPDGDDWLHEVKWDGYRMLCTIAGGKPTLWSRNAIEWTQRLPEIVEALAALGIDDARMDGELVALKDGVSDFNALQGGLSGENRVALVYVLFDLVHLQRWSLADSTLIERKDILRRIVELDMTNRVLYSEHHVGDGKRAFDQAVARKLEGIMSKRAASRYRSGRGDDWRKIKRLQSDEFAIVGFTAPKGARSGFGSLLLAAAEPDGTWRYVGRVGSGFSRSQLADLGRTLAGTPRAQPSVRAETIDPLLRGAHWVDPLTVAEVYYRGIGGLGLLRQPSLKAIRIDKTAASLAAEVRGKRAKEPIMATKIRMAKSTPTGKKSASRNPVLQPVRSPIKVTRRQPSTNVFGAVTLTHPERVVFPADGVTKLDVAEYYRQVMPRLLAGIEGRPLSVIRCPAGIAGECFFQKHLKPGLKHVASVSLKEESGSTGVYVYVDDADGAFELVQFNALEFHPWGATAADPGRAQYLVFDLDPAPEVAWARVVAAAIDVRDLLAKAGLKSFVRTTGGKGLHVVVPLRPAAKWDRAKKFAHALADSFAAVRPDEFLAVASKQRRDGKIFIDYLRNTRGATSVASYSLRARPGAPVAVPLRWAELKTLKGGDAFNIHNVPARLKRMRADPWAGYDSVRQGLDGIAAFPGK